MSDPNKLNAESGAVELLPCPFCGVSKAYPVEARRGWYVDCGVSACSGLGPERDTEDDAIAAWNQRAALQPPDPQVSHEFRADLKSNAGKLVTALESAREQLWHLAKDPTTNPWIAEIDAALLRVRGASS